MRNSRILRILDVSSYIHAGNVNKEARLDGPVVKTDKGYTCRDIAAGGISLIMNHLYYNFGKCDFLFCCDTRPTIKQAMYEDYKANRKHSEEISKAKDVAEIILKDCGFTVLREAGYEADDFIYSAVKKFYKEYDEIVIHTADSDLYFLVDNKVRIEKSNSRAKDVNMSNYGTSFGRDVEYMEYNMGAFYKVCYGDRSDNIPPLPNKRGYQVFQSFCKDSFRAYMGNKEYARSLIEVIAPDILPQFDLVYPLDVKVPNTIAIGSKEDILCWGKAMKNRLFSNVDFKYTGTVIEQRVMDMIEMGLYIE